jgi:leucyl-tRNA synthetase
VEAKLIVEMDGPVHDAQVEADNNRQELLEAAGYRVIRLTAADVEDDIRGSVDRIRAAVRQDY